MVEYRNAITVGVILAVVAGSGIVFALTSYLPSQNNQTTLANSEPPTLASIASANITVSGYPGEIAINTNANKIYVADLFESKLTVVSASTHASIGTITLPEPVGAGFGMAVDSRTGMVFVPSNGTVIEIDSTSDKIVGEIPFDMSRLAVNPITDILYGVHVSFGHSSSGSLLAVNVTSGKIIANTSLDADPIGIAVNAETGAVYVAACKSVTLACVGAEMLAVNASSHEIQWETQLSSSSTSPTLLGFDALNFNVIVNPSDDAVYTMGLDGANLTLVSMDGKSGAIRYSSNIGSSCAGAGGGVLAFDASFNRIYASFNSQGFFLAINGSTGRISGMLSSAAGIQYVAFNPVTNQVWVTPAAIHGGAGSLVELPANAGEGHVDSSLLQLGACFP